MKEEKETILSLEELLLDEANKEQDKEEKSLFQEQNSLGNRVEGIEKITGYKFSDPILLRQAFTHHSYEEGCSSFERLAYVGDATLNFLVSKEQYSLYPGLDPGKLTRLRAVNVDTEKLARVALQFELHKFLRHNTPLLAIQIEEFRNAVMEYPVHSCGLIDAPKVLADIVESLIGAIFIDSNSCTNTTCKIVKNLLKPMVTPETLPTHPVTQLQELCQKNGFTFKIRNLWEKTGEVEFIVNDGQFVGRAKYSSKRAIAKNRAAQDAYAQVVKSLSALEQ